MTDKGKEEKTDLAGEIKDIRLDYRKPDIPSKIPEKTKEQMEKTRKELEIFKKKVLKKYPFTIAIGILPPQASDKFEEEERIPEEEAKKKPLHLMVLIPEDNFKELNKIKLDLVNELKEVKQNVWVHVKTPVDVFNYSLDSKYDLTAGIAMSFPLFDNGFLGALRVAEIHKSLVLRKFEKYVTSYVIWGSLVRGEAVKSSDVDVAIIIDDTDVKRMPRLELKEKLRNIIYSYVMEASELAGVKNKLEPQIYILTEFWEGVKDANPVFFTLLRDGIPLYDRGTFMPWKLLLKMGKIKPSPESIDMFMNMSDKVVKQVEKNLMDSMILDMYWGVITPSQALLMLYGLPPPAPKEIQKGEFRKVFVEKEKLLEKKYADILERIVKVYKDYEHGKIKTIKGEDVDKYLADFKAYIKRLKELREQIEKRVQEKTVEELYENIFNMLKGLFGKKSESGLISDFETNFVKKGNLPPNYLKFLKDVVKAKKEFKKGKITKNEVENIRKNATSLINDLIDYGQRCELVSLQKGKFRLKTKDKVYELVLTDEFSFLIDKGEISKIDVKKKKLVNSDVNELTKALEVQRKKKEVKIDEQIFEILRKKIGSFEIIM